MRLYVSRERVRTHGWTAKLPPEVGVGIHLIDDVTLREWSRGGCWSVDVNPKFSNVPYEIYVSDYAPVRFRLVIYNLESCTLLFIYSRSSEESRYICISDVLRRYFPHVVSLFHCRCSQFAFAFSSTGEISGVKFFFCTTMSPQVDFFQRWIDTAQAGRKGVSVELACLIEIKSASRWKVLCV